MIGSLGTWGRARPLSKIEEKVAKYQSKVDNGQRCGFPPSRQRCVSLLEKWQGQLEAAQVQQLALQDVLVDTSPQATANAITAASAGNIAAIQADQTQTAYIVGGIVLLGALGVGAAMMLGGQGERR